MGSGSTYQSYEQLGDDALFAQVQQGDELAFRELYRRYKRRIFSYCLRLLQDRTMAEDVFQQTFLSVFEHRDQYKGGNLAAWIYTIARNWALKMRAQQQRIRNHELRQPEEAEAMGVSHYASPEQRVDYQIVLEYIAKLPVDYREALELRYLDGLAYKDIAEVLNISETLAKVRVFRAKKMLQKMLRSTTQEL